MQKIILYYKFTPLADPEAVRLWQTSLCKALGLRGRIIISKHGINGTLGGDIENLKSYAHQTKLFAPFRGTAFKWSDGTRDDFPRLSVKVRDELVSIGVPDELMIDQSGVVDGGKHLSPTAVHRLVAERGDDVVFFDGRNKHEAAIGRFKNAIVPDVTTSHDFVNELADPKYDAIKDKPVVTYCTGGIRCEILSTVMKKQGFKEVYQIDGGIAKYGERFKDSGLWEGSLYVFDERKTLKFSDQAKTIGECEHCGNKTDNYIDCLEPNCNRLALVCNECSASHSSEIHELICNKAPASSAVGTP